MIELHVAEKLGSTTTFREKALWFECLANFVLFCVFLGKLHLSQPIRAGVPSMPKNVKVVEYNDNTVRITWNHSDDPVVVYAVGYINVDLRSDEKYAAKDVAPTAVQYVVQGLKPNTRYMFFVRGINKIGHGVPSLLSDVVRTKLTSPTSKKPSFALTNKQPQINSASQHVIG